MNSYKENERCKDSAKIEFCTFFAPGTKAAQAYLRKYIRVILIFFLHLVYAGCAPAVCRVCARLGADGYLSFSLMS